MSERYAGLRSVVVEDTDGKAERIRELLLAAGVSYLGRLASTSAVREDLREYILSQGSNGLLALGNLFFIDGNLSPDSSNGEDGDGVLIALTEAGIAYPASYLDTHREQTLSAQGIMFGYSRDIGDGDYADTMLHYNLDPDDDDAESELRRMLDLAVELLPAVAQPEN